MAYNYFPYSPYGVQNMPNYSDLQYPQPNIQPQGNQTKNGIIWVQGEAGVKHVKNEMLGAIKGVKL